MNRYKREYYEAMHDANGRWDESYQDTLLASGVACNYGHGYVYNVERASEALELFQRYVEQMNEVSQENDEG